MAINADHASIFATILFGIGVIGLLTRRNLLVVFISVELMLNAVNLNLVALSRRIDGTHSPASGDAVALFVILLAAVEVAVGLGILIRLYDMNRSINIEDVQEIKD